MGFVLNIYICIGCSGHVLLYYEFRYSLYTALLALIYDLWIRGMVVCLGSLKGKSWGEVEALVRGKSG